MILYNAKTGAEVAYIRCGGAVSALLWITGFVPGEKWYNMKHFRESFMKYVFLFAAVMTVAAVIIICIFLFANGITAMA